MYETAILVILYPNKQELKQVIIVDPFDSKVELYKVDSLDEAKQVLEQHLPWCDQGHPPLIELGNAYVFEWEELPEGKVVIGKPIDVWKLR